MSDDKRLQRAMGELASAPGKMNFKGKLYSPVAMRVEMLRKEYGTELSITTEIVVADERVVIMRATIAEGERVLATGYAEEFRSTKGVNSTSALENAETSAVGRALAALGLGGGEYASADELAGAVQQQKAAEAQQQVRDMRQQQHDEALEANRASVDAIKAGIEEGDLSSAAESWFELGNDAKQALWLAPTKGGCFTTREREIIKSREFRESYYGPAEQAEEATA